MTTTNFSLPLGAAQSATSSKTKTDSLFQRVFARFIAAREMEARRRVAQFLTVQSDTRLADLGFSPAEIADIRRTGRIPASYYA